MKFLSFLRKIHSNKLNNLISKNAPYEEILKQSQILDKYIVKEFKILNNIK